MTTDSGKKQSKLRLIFTSLLPVFVLGHFSHHILTSLPGPMMPFIRDDFRLDYTRAGFVFAAFNIAYGVAQLLAGLLANRVSPRILILISTCGVALIGLLVSLSNNYIVMLIFMALLGVAGGGYHPAAAPLVSATLEPNQRGQALGFHTIGGSLSFLLSPLIAASVAVAWGWRSSFIALAVPTMILGIIVYLLLARHAGTGKAHIEAAKRLEGTSTDKGYWRKLIPFMVLSVFTGSILMSFGGFISIFTIDSFGIAEEAGARFFSLFFSAGLWASTLGGHLSDRFGKTRILLLCCFFSGPLIYLLSIVPYGGGISIGALILTLGALMYFIMPTTESYLVQYSPARHRSAILGAYYFLCVETGGLWAPFIGRLFDQYGFDFTFTALGGAILTVTIICFMFLRGRRD